MVSIIVPVFNREKELNKCIHSIINQSFKDIEIIIIDYGSTDSSPELCDELAKHDKRIRVFHNINQGVSASRNIGIEKSLGDYICFVDSDDYLDECFVELLYKDISNTKSDLAICNYFEISKGKVKNISWPRKYKNKLSSFQIVNDLLYSRTSNSFCWGRMWKKEALTASFKNVNYCEDTLFNIENLSNREHFVSYVKNPLYYYVRNENSITGKSEAKHLNDVLTVPEEIVKLAQTNENVSSNAALSLLINYAFYTYMLANKRASKEYETVKNKSINIINSYKRRVVFDKKASFKTRTACFLAIINSNLAIRTYEFLHYILNKL